MADYGRLLLCYSPQNRVDLFDSLNFPHGFMYAQSSFDFVNYNFSHRFIHNMSGHFYVCTATKIY